MNGRIIVIKSSGCNCFLLVKKEVSYVLGSYILRIFSGIFKETQNEIRVGFDRTIC